MRQKRTSLISLGKELRRITKEAQSVAPIFTTRKRNVTLAGNGALLNKRPRCTLRDRKKDQKCSFFCSKCWKHVHVLNTRILFATTAPVITISVVIVFILFLFICKWFVGLF